MPRFYFCAGLIFCLSLQGLAAHSQVAHMNAMEEKSEMEGTAISASTEEPVVSSVETPGQLPFGADPKNSLGIPLFKHLAGDQKQFWFGVARLDRRKAPPLFPLAALTGVLVASDGWMSRQAPDSPGSIHRSQQFSNYAAYSLLGAAGGAFLWGHLTHNEHLRETGLLSGEAAINSTAATFLLKAVTQRPRPNRGDGNGTFFQGGSSFPSEHAAVAWSVASVVAHEYPGPLTKFVSYGLASAVTVTRVTGKEHFPSDVLIGSALGWYLGRQVYRAHHDPGVGGTGWGMEEMQRESSRPRPDNMASPYVLPDSWVYPLMERLIALGYVQTAYVGLRPWTRLQCARMLEEAAERLPLADDGGEAYPMYKALAEEFAAETARLNGASNVGVTVDSVYTRVTNISGTPLSDGYHFAQTLIDDYGRPYAAGWNSVAGMTAHAVSGPFSLDFQGEYQHSPALPAYAPSVEEAIAAQDGTGLLSHGRGGLDRFRLLNGSVAWAFHGLQFSFGQQSLWLGPGEGGPFLFSNNAEPMALFRVDQTTPVYIPGLSRILGPMRTEFMLGRLSGTQWVDAHGVQFGPDIPNQPFLHGEKISFKPTPNLEFGMGITAIFGGPGFAVTWHNFLRSLYGNGVPGSAGDVADHRSTFEFSYRVPRLRDFLTVYADSLVEDEISPLGSTRPALRLGLYFSKVPHLPKLELRMEGVYTDVPGDREIPGYTYANNHYRSGYTNNGNLLASWVGRQGRGGQAWATYRFSARNFVQLEYRHQEVDKVFLQGGRLNDFGVRGEFLLNRNFAVSGLVQYEQWKFPLLAPSGQSNLTTSVQFTFYPGEKSH
ncbi:MAG: phosphatase PAP2 family protein [Acidobacteria bacterium]|nr:phosphatase PAP2 family protein [Acidobacteriota bacterium]